MSFRNRLSHPFIGVGIAVVAMLVIAGTLNRKHDSYQQRQTFKAATAQQQPAEPTTMPSPKGPEAVETNWGKPECSQPKTHDEADLCEQRRMAEAAENTLVLSKIQLILGVIGAALLFLTLFYGRQAARGAVVAARAAQASVATASDTAERQLRAYVSVTPATLQNFKTPWTVGYDCVVKNHGQTPASEINYVFGTGVFPNPLPPDFAFPAPDRAIIKNGALFPDKEYFVWFRHNEDLAAQDIADVESDAKRLHVWGTARYRDAFGRMRTTEFSASVGGQQFSASVNAMLSGGTAKDFRWEWGEHHGRST